MQDRGAGAQGDSQHRLDRRDVRDHQYGAAAVPGDDSFPGPLDPIPDLIEALSTRRPQAGVAQPATVHIGVALRRLEDRQPLPLPEIGLDQVVVDLHGEAEGVRGRGSGVARPLQRGTDDRRDAALGGQMAGGVGGLAAADVGEFGVPAARIAALHRQFGLSVPQQQQAGGSAAIAGPG